MTSQRRPPRRRQAEPPKVSGIVNLYKPRWESSAQYVYRLRKVYGEWKVGHAGTLDPFADGVVIGCIGRGTKLVEKIMALPKAYRTTIRLGVTNESFDPEQPFEPVDGAKPVDRAAIEEVIQSLRGEVNQAPPAFSAVKINGRSSYHLARKGDAADRPSRPVMIYRNDIVSYNWPTLELDILCGRGTYIRAIARDIGAALECGGVCETLARTAIGPFAIGDALRLDESDDNEKASALMTVEDATDRIESYQISI